MLQICKWEAAIMDFRELASRCMFMHHKDFLLIVSLPQKINIIRTFSLPESKTKIAHGIDIQIRGSHLIYKCW